MGYPILALAVIALVIGPGIWVRRVMDTHSVPDDRYPGSGSELARHLLDLHGLKHVKVEEINEGDHYDPNDKAVRLTPDKFSGASLTAITVAAHEVGHALQDAEGYGPLKLRSRLVRIIGPVQKVGAGILVAAPFLTMITRAPGIGLLSILAGMLTLLSATVVHFVTLPTEFDASFNRALPILDRHGILRKSDRRHARRLLSAAAMTYVSASLMSLLNIARWIAILRR